MNVIKNIRNNLNLKKENEATKDKMISEIRNLFESRNEDYHEPIRVSSFYSNDCIDYKSNGYRDKDLSIKEYLNKIKQYLKILELIYKNPILEKFN